MDKREEASIWKKEISLRRKPKASPAQEDTVQAQSGGALGLEEGDQPAAEAENYE